MAGKLETDDGTFLYIMYIEKIRMTTEAFPQLEGVCRWYVDSAHACSEQVELTGTESTRVSYCVFLVISFRNLADRSKAVTMTLSMPGGQHICVSFLDVKDFGQNETFKIQQVELKNQEGTFAIADIHTAAQSRWTRGKAIVPQDEAYFVDPADDEQSRYLHEHISKEVGMGPAKPKASEPAPSPTAQASNNNNAPENSARSEASNDASKGGFSPEQLMAELGLDPGENPAAEEKASSTSSTPGRKGGGYKRKGAQEDSPIDDEKEKAMRLEEEKEEARKKEEEALAQKRKTEEEEAERKRRELEEEAEKERRKKEQEEKELERKRKEEEDKERERRRKEEEKEQERKRKEAEEEREREKEREKEREQERDRERQKEKDRREEEERQERERKRQREEEDRKKREREEKEEQERERQRKKREQEEKASRDAEEKEHEEAESKRWKQEEDRERRRKQQEEEEDEEEERSRRRRRRQQEEEEEEEEKRERERERRKREREEAQRREEEEEREREKEYRRIRELEEEEEEEERERERRRRKKQREEEEQERERERARREQEEERERNMRRREEEYERRRGMEKRRWEYEEDDSWRDDKENQRRSRNGNVRRNREHDERSRNHGKKSDKQWSRESSSEASEKEVLFDGPPWPELPSSRQGVTPLPQQTRTSPPPFRLEQAAPDSASSLAARLEQLRTLSRYQRALGARDDDLFEEDISAISSPPPAWRRSAKTMEATTQTATASNFADAAVGDSVRLSDADVWGQQADDALDEPNLPAVRTPLFQERLLKLMRLHKELGGRQPVNGAHSGENAVASRAKKPAAEVVVGTILDVLRKAADSCHEKQDHLRRYCEAHNLNPNAVCPVRTEPRAEPQATGLIQETGTGYLEPQLEALRRLREKYESLLQRKSSTSGLTSGPVGLNSGGSGPVSTNHEGDHSLFKGNDSSGSKQSYTGPNEQSVPALGGGRGIESVSRGAHRPPVDHSPSLSSTSGPDLNVKPRATGQLNVMSSTPFRGPMDPGGEGPQPRIPRLGGASNRSSSSPRVPSITPVLSARDANPAHGLRNHQQPQQATPRVTPRPSQDPHPVPQIGVHRQGVNASALHTPIAFENPAPRYPHAEPAYSDSVRRSPPYPSSSHMHASGGTRHLPPNLNGSRRSEINEINSDSPIREALNAYGSHGAGVPDNHTSSRVAPSKEASEDKYLKILQNLQAKGGGILTTPLIDGSRRGMGKSDLATTMGARRSPKKDDSDADDGASHNSDSSSDYPSTRSWLRRLEQGSPARRNKGRRT